MVILDSPRAYEDLNPNQELKCVKQKRIEKQTTISDSYYETRYQLALCLLDLLSDNCVFASITREAYKC